MSTRLVCGIDIGTSGVRALVCDATGRPRGEGTHRLEPVRVSGARREQDADDWWRAAAAATRQAVAAVDPAHVDAVAVDATSGTLVPVDDALRPLGPGLMYNDARAADYVDRVNAAAARAGFLERHGYAFEGSFALPRLLWLRDHHPAFDRVTAVLHQGDFVNARLIGAVPPTDWSTALKSGCDLFAGAWGAFIEPALGFPLAKLPPRVVAPGTVIGRVGAEAAAATGLVPGTAVAAGATDGTAALLASGAGAVGDFNSALGTTLVVKGITEAPLRDPDGVVYCHRHPDGPWLPGGASNVGGAALARDASLDDLDDLADPTLPCPAIAYPLADAGNERFPFRRRGIEGFFEPPPRSRVERHAAVLQGVAFVERWCYEKLESLGARVDRIFSTGGGSTSGVWTQLRADVLRRAIALPDQPATALGAAILAASSFHGSVAAAGRAMVRIERRVEPGRRDFEPAYRRFRAECRDRWGAS